MILAFTGLSFRSIDRTARPGAAAYIECVGCCYLLLCIEINSRRLGTCGRGEVAIAEYRLICVVRRADGHPRAVGYSSNGNEVMYDEVWTIEEARKAVKQGHRLYVVNPASSDRREVDLESFEDLEDLPPCG